MLKLLTWKLSGQKKLSGRKSKIFKSDCCYASYVRNNYSHKGRIENYIKCTKCYQRCSVVRPIIKCVICGTQVEKLIATQVTCGTKACSYIRQRTRINRWKKTHPEKVRIYDQTSHQRHPLGNRLLTVAVSCIGCNVIVPTWTKNSKYCPECKKKQARTLNAIWQRGAGKETHRKHAREYARRQSLIKRGLL